MRTKIRHGRERLHRGRLKTFSDLPLCAQVNFQKIAEELTSVLDEPTDIFVYGSYYWGFWDKDSDYDVRLHTSPSKMSLSAQQFQGLMFEKIGSKVDLMFMSAPEHKVNYIQIPI